MIGLQAIMMLSLGCWCSVLGVVVGRPYGIAGGFAGFVVGLISGVFLGALIGELESELTLRAGVARESGQNLKCSLWVLVSVALWLTITGALLWSCRMIT